MTYSADSDLELAFGASNVQKWADLDGGGVPDTIDARKLWAREQAYAEINAKLQDSIYQFPLPDQGADGYPSLLIRMEAYLAGVLLYESRGVTDVGEDGKAQHQLMWHRQAVDRFIRDIWARRLKLPKSVVLAADAVTATSDAPAMVSFDDPGGVREATILSDDFITILGPVS